jgi:uncharacterized SAM-binding protein YcdF (DUF218 family)
MGWRILLLVFGIWLGGFLAFSYQLMDAPASTRKTDGMIALTGGEKRIERAIVQMAKGKAKRLLVSGVHRSTTKADLRARTNGSKKLFDCCIDIGHAASNTIGNAVEAAVWMDANGFRSLRLVTSKAHMPRAQLEFIDAMPNILIIPDAVDVDNSIAARIGEYNKYIARLILLRLKQL